MELVGSCLIVFVHLILDERFDFCCNFRWPSRSRSPSNGASLFKLSQKLCDPNSACFQLLFLKQFHDGWRFRSLQVVKKNLLTLVGTEHHPEGSFPWNSCTTFKRSYNVNGSARRHNHQKNGTGMKTVKTVPYYMYVCSMNTERKLYIGLYCTWWMEVCCIWLWHHYFSSACGFGVKFILASLFETMHVFLQCGFKTKPLHVMEQAQPNPLDGWLDTEHMETRHQGAQMTSMLRVKTWFLNPFTNEKVFTPYAHRTRLAHCMLLFHY